MEDIRAGKWDDRIKASLRGEKVSLDIAVPPEPSGVFRFEGQ